MKILVIEDNDEQQKAAWLAVEASGHSCAIVTSLRYDPNSKYGEASDAPLHEVDGVITDLHFLPDVQVLEGEYGYEEYKKYNIPYRHFFGEMSKPDGPDLTPPSGLLAVIDAIMAGKPVVICTDVNHHEAGGSWIYDRYMHSLGRKANLPFGWNDRKDWCDAVRQLEERYAGRA